MDNVFRSATSKAMTLWRGFTKLEYWGGAARRAWQRWALGGQVGCWCGVRGEVSRWRRRYWLPVAPGPLRVCYWNAEDPEDETERRFAAACIQYGVEPESLEGRLFLDHKFTPGRRLARADAHGRIRVDPEVLEWVLNFIGEHAIDVLMCDPFVAFHRVPEIDNGAMEELIKTVIEPIAAKRNCCIELAQHTRKPSFGQRADITADDARGASAQINASRSVRVINRMTQEEALLPGISAEDRKLYIRVSRDKPNFTPAGKSVLAAPDRRGPAQQHRRSARRQHPGAGRLAVPGFARTRDPARCVLDA
jgi:RecA-family ATPase